MAPVKRRGRTSSKRVSETVDNEEGAQIPASQPQSQEPAQNEPQASSAPVNVGGQGSKSASETAGNEEHDEGADVPASEDSAPIKRKGRRRKRDPFSTSEATESQDGHVSEEEGDASKARQLEEQEEEDISPVSPAVKKQLRSAVKKAVEKKPSTSSGKTFNQSELRQSWSLEELKIIYEAIKLTGGVDDVSQLTEVLPGKTAEEIETYIAFCRKTHLEHYNRIKSVFDCDKPTTPLEFWLSTMDDLVGDDSRWMRRAFSLAIGILGRYEEPSFPVYGENGEMPADVPNYGAIYNWLAVLMLGYPEQPKSLRPIDAMIVLDLLEQLQQSANLRVSKNVPPLELLQRKHRLLKAPSWKRGDAHYPAKKRINERRIGLALAREDQCDLMRFTENQMRAVTLNPPVEYEEGSGKNFPPALKPGETLIQAAKGNRKTEKTAENGKKTAGGDEDDQWTDVSSEDEEEDQTEEQDKIDDTNQGSQAQTDNPFLIKKPFAQRLQAINPFRLSKKYSRLELWSIPDGLEDDPGTSNELL